MTEKDIQLKIYYNLTSLTPLPIVIPNVYHFNWESDMLLLKPSGYLYEYEIKRTLSDFRADKKKYYKHFLMKDNNNQRHSVRRNPRLFYYVCPVDIIPLDQVPEYSGLIYVYENTWMWKIIKKAPILKSEKLSVEKMMKLSQKGVARYWKLRRDENRND